MSGLSQFQGKAPAASSGVGSVGGAVNSLVTRTLAPLEGGFARLGAAVEAITRDSVAPFRNALGRLSDSTRAAVGGAFAPLNEAASQFSGGLTSLVGGVTGFYGSLSEAGGSLGKFVELFSPSLLLPFQQGMRDLGALIGSSLAPAFGVLTDVVKGVGANLAPVFDRLRQIITPLAQTMGDVFLRVVKSVSNLFQAMAPLLETAVRVMAPVVEGLASLAEAASAAVAAVVQSFFSALDPKKNGVVSFAEGLRKILDHLAKGLILVVAALAKWAGSNAILENLEKNLNERAQNERDITGNAAVRDARFSSFAEFGRQMALRASVATGAPERDPQKEQEDWRKSVREDIKSIRDGTKPVGEVLAAWGEKFAGQLGEEIVKRLREAIPGEPVGNPWNPGWKVRGIGAGLRKWFGFDEPDAG